MGDEKPPIEYHEPEYEDTINFALSKQSLDLLEQLAELGIFGESSAEVGARFVDRALTEFVECDMEPPPMTGEEESEIMARRMTYEELIALQLPKIDFHDSRYEETINRSLSTQSLYVLDRLADLGIYGKTSGEVGARFVDRALQEFVQHPRFVIKRKEK